MSNDITALAQRLKVYAEEFSYPVLSPDDCRALVEALEKAQNKATSEPVALRWRWNDNEAHWTYAPASKMPDFVAAGFSLENGVVIESLYTAPPAMESRTVTVKLYDDFQLCHYGTSEDYAKGYIDCQNNFTKWLAAAGIQVIEGEGQ